MNLNYITSAITLLIGFISFSQLGSISGKVADSATGETIPGAKITVENVAKGAMTDLDGNFLIQNLAVGAYSLNISYYLYNTKIVTDILVKENEVTTLTISLDKTVKEIGPITVKVTINKESNANLLQLQRNSASVIDGISGDMMKKSVDSKASDVLKRVSGASVQDNKFVVIRGLSDRYNFALIN